MSTANIPASEGAESRQFLDRLGDGIYYVDRERRILLWNDQAERITGFRREEVEKHHCFDDILGHVDEQGRSLCLGECPLTRVLRDGTPLEERLFLHHKDGHRVAVTVRVAPVRGPDGEIIGAVESFSEEAWREVLGARLAELERLTLLDPLTGLLNRRGMEQAIEARWDEHQRYGWPFGVLLIDLDDFKRVNDEHGHDVGDAVLRMVAQSLTAGSRTFDSVGRWGGEEFVAAVTNVEPPRLLAIAERLCRLVEQSCLREHPGVGVTCSIGAASIRPEETIPELLQRADALMYQAKREGGNRVRA
jgi:diguanylate cyclase (GGDEF)-like protein/PAS domain S-box-containing protein